MKWYTLVRVASKRARSAEVVEGHEANASALRSLRLPWLDGPVGPFLFVKAIGQVG